MNKALVGIVLLSLVVMAGCIGGGDDEKSLEDFFEEKRVDVSSTNKTVTEGNYLVGRIKSVNETAVDEIWYNQRCYYYFYTVTFEDGAELKSYNIGLFPYKSGAVNGIEFRSFTSAQRDSCSNPHPSLGCRVEKVIF